MSANDLHDDDPALDRLLAQARWEEPSAADEYRLREDWIDLRRRRRIGPALYLAAAASVALVIGMLSLLRPAPVNVAKVQERMPLLLVTEGREPQPEVIPSRPATSYEVLIAMQSGVASNPSSGVAMPAPRPVAALDPTVQRLVHQLGDPLVKKRYEAAQELAMSDQPQVVPVLTEMVAKGVNRREALTALLLSTDPSAARALAEVRASRAIDAQLTAIRIELQGTNLLRRFSWSVAL